MFISIFCTVYEFIDSVNFYEFSLKTLKDSFREKFVHLKLINNEYFVWNMLFCILNKWQKL